MGNDRYVIKRYGHKITNTTNPGQNEVNKKLEIYYAQKTLVSVSIKHPWFIETEKNEHLWRLKEFTKWLFSKYAHISFFIADSLHRYNINLNAINSDNNFVKAIEIGELQRKIILDVIKEIDIQDNRYEFITSSDIFLNKDFKSILESVQKYFSNDDTFRDAIIKSAEDYWYRKYKDGFCYLSQQHDITSSTSFIIEEIAYFTFMSKILEYKTNIYPGDFLFVFRSIDFKKYSELSDLANQNFQTVKIKKKL